MSDLVAAKDKAVDADMKAKLEAAEAAAAAMVKRAESVEAYDQMLGEGNAEGNAVVEKVVQARPEARRVGQRVSVRVDLGGRRIIKTKTQSTKTTKIKHKT